MTEGKLLSCVGDFVAGRGGGQGSAIAGGNFNFNFLEFRAFQS